MIFLLQNIKYRVHHHHGKRQQAWTALEMAVLPTAPPAGGLSGGLLVIQPPPFVPSMWYNSPAHTVAIHK